MRKIFWCGASLLAFVAAFVYSPASVSAQDQPNASSKLVQGKQLFSRLCAGCHGADAHGGDRAPSLVGNARLRSRSASELQAFIRGGNLSSGMPAFDLPARQLEAIAALVRSWNPPTGPTAAAADVERGQQFFFGEGKCVSCHMVEGWGEPIGPDLSNVGKELTTAELRAVLLEPNAHITPGYELVSVRLRDGQTVRGFARSRSNFDIQIQDLQGYIRPVHADQITAITQENQSLMAPVKASPEELQDLIAYLASLTGVKPGVPLSAKSDRTGGIKFSRVLDPKPGDWLSYNGRLSANRYSDLSEINTSNAGHLELAWSFPVPLWKQFLPETPYFIEKLKHFAVETTPLVADGIMYVTGPQQAFALDAATGRLIWEYSRPRTQGLVGDASLGTNRGAAILDDKLFMVTDNAHLIALNRTTGRLVWEAVMPDELQHYGSTVAPLVVKDMVIAGVSGADWGIRGFLSAYRASTGERVWRHWTIPGAGEPGSETWIGKLPKLGGGSTWLTGSYDPETDTLYWSTATPFPNYNGQDRPGDNLFTDSILALDPGTGKLKWYYQTTPHDEHAWDATEPLVLVNTHFRGEDRKLLLQANRNGFFYVFDRSDGQILLAKPFLNRVTWASGIGPDGRPQRLPAGDVTCPESATNWNSTAFSPATRLFYVMAVEKCASNLPSETQPPEEPAKQYLRALNIETGKTVWETQQIGAGEGTTYPGILATAGGVLFYGDPSGYFVAADQRNGAPLWHFPTNAIISASPMTYAVGGKQYVAIAAGPNIMAFKFAEPLLDEDARGSAAKRADGKGFAAGGEETKTAGSGSP